MIGRLLKHRDKAVCSTILTRLRVREQSYGLGTLHRPRNVDCPQRLEAIISALHELAEHLPILFPCHLRTREKIEAGNLAHYFTNQTSEAGLEAYVSVAS